MAVVTLACIVCIVAAATKSLRSPEIINQHFSENVHTVRTQLTWNNKEKHNGHVMQCLKEFQAHFWLAAT